MDSPNRKSNTRTENYERKVSSSSVERKTSERKTSERKNPIEPELPPQKSYKDQIKEILKNTYNDGIIHTHVSLITPKGKFQFNRQTLEDFWEVYCNALYNDFENSVYGIAEKPQQYLPVIVDVDLKADADFELIDDSLYTIDQVKYVISTYQSVLRNSVQDCTSQDLTCVFLQKNLYQQTKNDKVFLKHGFHLHFPYLFLNKNDQEVHIIPRVQESLREHKAFENLGIEDSGSVIDKACCKVPWLLYGSRKSETSEPYKVSKVYNEDCIEISLEKAFKSYIIMDKKEKIIDIKGKVQFYLPRILSILPFGRTTKELRKGLVSPLKEKMKKDRKVSSSYRKLNLEDSLEMLRKLLPLLADFRAESRDDWLSIGWAIFNITDGDPEGLNIWCEFSSRCDEKYDETVCINTWNSMVKKDIGIGTIRYFASLDNPTEYKKFKEEQSNKHIIESLEGSHNDVAKALYEEYGDEFVCASYTNKLWFQFKNHKWEQIEDGVTLREKISGSIVNRFNEARKALCDIEVKENDKSKQAMYASRLKQINKMIVSLKNSTYKNSVMKECCEIFYDPKFAERLDTDGFLIAFKNGVYDLRLNIFRPGRPEDYLSKSMPINYVNFSECDERVQEVYTFLEQVFPDKSIRRYFMDISSDIFVGGNHEKTVVFWTGEGDNGKTVTQTFFEKMMGKLAIKLDTNIITGKKRIAGSAFADLARAGGGVRWAVFEEPDGDESINSGALKKYSGNDSFYARDLFEKGKDGREIQPLFKIIFICNKLPIIKYADKAVWNRVRVLPFESTFCRPSNPAPESYEEQLRQKRFPMDKSFSTKIPNLVEAFAWVLLQHRFKYFGMARVPEPEKVLSATNKYQKQNDIYRQFVEECIVEDEKAYIVLGLLYNAFKEWYRESMPNHTVPIKNEVEEYFSKLWGYPLEGKRWKGYRTRMDKDNKGGGKKDGGKGGEKGEVRSTNAEGEEKGESVEEEIVGEEMRSKEESEDEEIDEDEEENEEKDKTEYDILPL
jgi:P4 family phage/plasmid primase-like protien